MNSSKNSENLQLLLTFLAILADFVTVATHPRLCGLTSGLCAGIRANFVPWVINHAACFNSTFRAK